HSLSLEWACQACRQAPASSCRGMAVSALFWIAPARARQRRAPVRAAQRRRASRCAFACPDARGDAPPLTPLGWACRRAHVRVPAVQLHALMDAAVALARGAGSLLRAAFAAGVRADQVQHKGPIDLVTEADRASEEHLLRGIHARFPE